MFASVITIARPDFSVVEKHAVVFDDNEDTDKIISGIEKALKPYAHRYKADVGQHEYFHHNATKDAPYFFNRYHGSHAWSAGEFRCGYRFSIESFELNDEAVECVKEALEVKRLADYEGCKSDRTDMRIRADSMIQQAICGAVEWVVIRRDADGVEDLLESGLSYDNAHRLVEKTEIADRHVYEEWLESQAFYDGEKIQKDPRATEYTIRCYRRLTEKQRADLGL